MRALTQPPGQSGLTKVDSGDSAVPVSRLTLTQGSARLESLPFTSDGSFASNPPVPGSGLRKAGQA